MSFASVYSPGYSIDAFHYLPDVSRRLTIGGVTWMQQHDKEFPHTIKQLVEEQTKKMYEEGRYGGAEQYQYTATVMWGPYSPYRGGLLFHGMGSGKTYSGIIWANEMLRAGAGRILVMCPACLVGTWQTEIAMWKQKYRGVDWKIFIDGPRPTHNLFFVPYNGSSVQSNITELGYNDGDVPTNCGIIIDESHNFVNAVLKVRNKAHILKAFVMGAINSKVLALSGTPFVNIPFEASLLFNVLKGYMLDGKVLFPSLPDDFHEHYLKNGNMEASVSGMVSYKELVSPTLAVLNPYRTVTFPLTREQTEQYRQARDKEKKMPNDKSQIERFMRGHSDEIPKVRQYSRSLCTFVGPSYVPSFTQMKLFKIEGKPVSYRIAPGMFVDGHPMFKLFVYMLQIIDSRFVTDVIKGMFFTPDGHGVALGEKLPLISRHMTPDMKHKFLVDNAELLDTVMPEKFIDEDNRFAAVLARVIGTLTLYQTTQGTKAEINKLIEDMYGAVPFIFSPPHLAKHSPKIDFILNSEATKEIKGVKFVWSFFTGYGGLSAVRRALLAKGYMMVNPSDTFADYASVPQINEAKEHFLEATTDYESMQLRRETQEGDDIEEGEDEAPRFEDFLPQHRVDGKAKRFVFLTGDMSKDNMIKLMQLCNHPLNFNGEYIEWILGSSVVAEGVSFNYGRACFVLEKYWNMGKLDQVFARIRRLRSHQLLPEEDRTIDTFILQLDDEDSTDEYMSNLSDKKYAALKPTIDMMQRVAVDMSPETTRADLLDSVLFTPWLVGEMASFIESRRKVHRTLAFFLGTNPRKGDPKSYYEVFYKETEIENHKLKNAGDRIFKVAKAYLEESCMHHIGYVIVTEKKLFMLITDEQFADDEASIALPVEPLAQPVSVPVVAIAPPPGPDVSMFSPDVPRVITYHTFKGHGEFSSPLDLFRTVYNTMERPADTETNLKIMFTTLATYCLNHKDVYDVLRGYTDSQISKLSFTPFEDLPLVTKELIRAAWIKTRTHFENQEIQGNTFEKLRKTLISPSAKK